MLLVICIIACRAWWRLWLKGASQCLVITNVFFLIWLIRTFVICTLTTVFISMYFKHNNIVNVLIIDVVNDSNFIHFDWNSNSCYIIFLVFSRRTFYIFCFHWNFKIFTFEICLKWWNFLHLILLIKINSIPLFVWL